MIATILRTSILSVIILVILHLLYNHLQTTLTVPKVCNLAKKMERKNAEIDVLIHSEVKSELNDFLKQLKM